MGRRNVRDPGKGYSGQVMLEAEQVALNSGIAASIVRLTGIYGPGREWLLTQVRQGYRVAIDPPLYGNRIHVDDAAGLLAFFVAACGAGRFAGSHLYRCR